MGEFSTPNYKAIKFNEKLVVSYAPEAEFLKESPTFVAGHFIEYFKTKLQKKGVSFSDTAKETLDIQFQDARFRSQGVAMWIGTFAGADSVELDLTTKDVKGIPIDKNKIKVSYALGGLLGGWNDFRSKYFYKKITNLIFQQLGLPGSIDFWFWFLSKACSWNGHISNMLSTVNF
ncbi:hypothetical protein AB3N59_14850 [Leptospira sp. WS92.C1]